MDKQNSHNEDFKCRITKLDLFNPNENQLYFDFLPEVLPAIKEVSKELKDKLIKRGLEKAGKILAEKLVPYGIKITKDKIDVDKKYSHFHHPLASNIFLYPPMALYSKQPMKKSEIKTYVEYIGKDFKITVGSKKGVLNEFDEFVFKAGVLSFIRKNNDQVIACFSIPQLLKKLKMKKDGRIYKKICNALEKIEGMYMEHTKFMLFDGKIIKLPPQDLFVCRPMTISNIEDLKIIQEFEKYDLERLLSLKQQRPRLYLFIFDSPFKDRLLNEKWRFHDIRIYKKLSSPISRRLYELYLIAPKRKTLGRWFINIDELLKLIPIRTKRRRDAIKRLKTNLKHLYKVTGIYGEIADENVIFYKKERQTRIRKKKLKIENVEIQEIKQDKPKPEQPKPIEEYKTKVIEWLLKLGYIPKEIDMLLNSQNSNIIDIYNLLIKDLPKEELKSIIDKLLKNDIQNKN